MSKTFVKGLNALIDTRPEEVTPVAPTPIRARLGRPVTQHKTITKSSQEGTKENETRATFIVNETLLEELKAIAYWDRCLIKVVINDALQDAIDKYKKKHGGVIAEVPNTRPE